MVALLGSDVARKQLYNHVLRSRILLSVVVFPLVAVLAWLLAADGHEWIATLMGLSMAASGLSFAWYSIGVGDVRAIAIYDTLPKVLAILIALILMLTTRLIWPYPVLLLAATCLGLALFHKQRIGQSARLRETFSTETIKAARRNSTAALIDGTSILYVATPIPISSMFNSSLETATLASADKIFRYGLYAVSALGNTLQSWVLQPLSPNPRRRHIFAITVHVLLGIAGFAFLAIFGPWSTRLLFGAAVATTQPVATMYGIAYLAVSTSTPFMRNILLPRGQSRAVLLATILGACVGLPLMVLWGRGGQSWGIAAGLAASELTVLVTAVLAVFLWPKRPANVHEVPPRDGTDDYQSQKNLPSTPR